MKRRLPYVHEALEVILPPVGAPWEFPAKVRMSVPPRRDQLQDLSMPERVDAVPLDAPLMPPNLEEEAGD
eukprot:4609187-Alexandrium_andersonii.AAC.1